MPNFAISDMPPIVLPIDPANTFLETETEEGGVQVSRQISAADLLGAAPGLDATFITLSANVGLANERILTQGAGISIVDSGAGLPITISILSAFILPAGTADFSSLRYDLGGGIWVENTAISFQIDSIFVDEKAAAFADIAGRGQYWVRNDVPNTPMFTDDVGNDFVLNASGGAGISGTPVNNQIAIWVDASNIEGDPDLTFAASVLTMTNASGVLTITRGITDVTISNLAAGGDIFYNTLADHVFQIAGVTLFEIDNGGGRFLFNDFGVFFEERGSAGPDLATYGQVWVRNDAVNTLMFTDNLGNDFVIGGASAGFATLAGANVFTNANAILLPQANDAATPTLAFGDGDTGFYETITDDQLTVSVAGVARWYWLGNQFTSFSAGAGPMMLDLDATAVIPNICPNNADGNTGIGWGSGSGDQLSLIAGGVEIMRMVEGADDYIRANVPMLILERAAAVADIAAFGQLWVANDVANTLRFTDDIGTEMRVNCTQWFNKFGDQQSVNNTTVFENVTSLSGFQFDLGAIYHIEIFLKTNQANASADIAVRLNPQGGGTFTDEFFQITSISDNGTFTFQDNGVFTALGAVQNVVGNHALHIVGTVEAGVADLWDLQFAQGTAQVANTFIDDASYLRITKIG